MADLDKTLEIIPVNVLEEILSDDNTFSDFINSYDRFADVDKENYVASLNNFMTYYIKHKNDIDKNVFDKINYINSYFKVDYIYSYDDYLSNTDIILSIDIVEKILKDPVVFNKFMDFENNKDFFEYDLNSYLIAINEYFVALKKVGIDIGLEEFNRYMLIINSYSLELRRQQIFDGEYVNGIVDKSIIKRVLGNKYNDISNMKPFDKFAMCRDIYVELCKILCYDVNFAALKQDISNDYVKGVYNSNFGDVTLKRNNVVCKTFSEIYAALLNMVGINAKIAGNFHKYVLFDCDGTLMKADATNSFFSEILNFYINDITAVKLEIPTVGFVCMEEDKKIDKQIHMADLRNNFYKQSINMKFLQDYKLYKSRHVFLKKKNNYGDTFDEKLILLSKMCKENDLNGFDLSKYFTIVVCNILKGKEDRIDTCHVALKENGNNYNAGIILSRLVDGDYQFYAFFKSGIKKVSREQLLKLINDGTIKVMSNSGINGLYTKQQEEVNINGLAM